MARIRTVYPTDRIPHLWIHGTQDNAHNPGGNLFFTGPAIYSYGPHYVAGFILPDCYTWPAGVADSFGNESSYSARIVLLNGLNYSNTTNKHKSAVHYASRNVGFRVSVSSLNDGDISTIHRQGLIGIVKKLAQTMRGYADHASKARIRPATRACALRCAGDTARVARALLSMDIARRDLSKEAKARVRAMLRTLPGSIPTDGEDRAGALAFARSLNRAQWVAEMRQLAGAANKHMAAASYNPDGCGSAYLGKREAERANNTAHVARSNARKALELAAKAETRAPAGMAALVKKADAAIAETSARIAEYVRLESIDAWPQTLAVFRESVEQHDVLWSITRARDRAIAAAVEIADESVTTGITPLLAQCAARLQSLALESADAALYSARDYAQAGHIPDAMRDANRARNDAQEAGEKGADILVQSLALIEELKARAERENAQTLADWRAGTGSLPLAIARAFSGALLRVKGDTVETSRGASVPVGVCPMVWRAATQCRKTGTPHEFGDDAPRLGHFPLNRITADGDITAGCHFIEFSELAAVAAVLGYTDAGCY